MQYKTTQCNALQYMQYCVQCYTRQYNKIQLMRYNAILYKTKLYNPMQYNICKTLQNNVIQDNTIYAIQSNTV